MITTFNKMVESNNNLSFNLDEEKLIFQLQTENLEDVYVAITSSELCEEIQRYEIPNPKKEYPSYAWKLLFEKAISKYQQARTQLMKRC